MTDEEYMVRKAKVELRIKKIREELEDCKQNIFENSSKKMDGLFKELEKAETEIEDMIIELQVDDFLENGAGLTDNKYEDTKKK